MTKARTTPSQAPEDESGLDRRGFLKGAAAAGAATAAAMTAATQIAQAAEAKPAQPEGEANMRGNAFVSRPGSDFLGDDIKPAASDHLHGNSASSLRRMP